MSTELTFGQWLQRRRRGLGFTQDELGKRIGYSGETVRKVEADALRPSGQMAHKLAESLAIPADERAAFIRFARDERMNEFSVPPTTVAQPAGSPQQPPPAKLPTPPTPLVGREQEIAAACQLLRQPDVRHVTFTGPGGVGKTRLALEVARRVASDFPDGVYFVDLAPITEPDLAPSAVVHGLGLKDSPAGSPTQQLKEFLPSKHALLLLDNYEQIAAAGVWLADLLRAAPHSKALVTSRVLLRVRGEREYAVPPLLSSEAVQLFVERVRDAEPDFILTPDNTPAVVEICDRLDGLPLALELAAARARVLSPAELAPRLHRRLTLLTAGPHDLPSRQQTLRATLDWSYALLTPEEQALFDRLAVFVGGFTLSAVEDVCAFGSFILDGLHSLVDKSLVRRVDGPGGRRFNLLEIVREYAVEKLAARGERDLLHQRHAAFFLGLVEQAEPLLVGAEQALWLARLGAERDNIRAAFAYWRETGQTEAALRLASGLRRFWEVQGEAREGRAWLQDALAQAESVTSAVHAKALYSLATMLMHLGDYAEATAWCETALARWRDLGDRQGEARALHLLAVIAWSQNQYPRSRELHEASLAIKRELNDRIGIAHSVGALGMLATEIYDYARARALLAEGVALQRVAGDQRAIANGLQNLGNVARQQGDLVDAVALYEEALQGLTVLGDKPSLSRVQNNLAIVLGERGDFQPARALVLASLAWRKQFGTAREITVCWLILAQIALDEGDLSQARLASEEALTLAREPLYRPYLARALTLLGRVALREGQFTLAAPLLTEALELAETIGDKIEQIKVRRSLGWLAYYTGEIAAAQSLFEASLRLADSIGHRLGVAPALEALAAVYLASEQPERAAATAGYCAQLRAQMGAPLPPSDQLEYELLLATLRHRLGPEQFTRWWSEGRTQSLADLTA